MNLFFCALVLVCMLLFDEIEASAWLRIATKGKKKDRAESTTSGHLYTSRATTNLPRDDNEETLGQRALNLHEHVPVAQEEPFEQNFQHLIRGSLNVEPPSKKQKKQQAFFCEHHGFSPKGLKKELAALRAERRASTLPIGNLNLGDTGTNNFVAPPALPHPQADNAGIPFNPNFAHPSGGYGTQGYVQPAFHQFPWGTGTDFGGTGTGYGGAGTNYGGAGTNYGGAGTNYEGAGWGDGGSGSGYEGAGWGDGGTGSGYEGTGWGGGGTGPRYGGSGWGDEGSGSGNGK